MPQIAGPLIIGLKIIGVAANIAVPLANAIVYVGLSLASSALTAALTRTPQPENGKSTVKQELPSRAYAFGRCRVSGPFLLREARENLLGRVIALPEGPVDHFGQVWLNDDPVVMLGENVQPGDDGRYPDNRVRIWFNLGAETETAFAQAITDFPTYWTSNHRGDGIPSMYIRCNHGDVEDFNRDFPNRAPDPSVEAFYAAYDWRDEGQDREDPSTWTHTANPVVGLVNALWRRFGQDWDETIAPNLASHTAEADKCDEPVDLAAGGTEPRYEAGFFWYANNEPQAIVDTFISAMDGWLGPDRNGAWLIYCGHEIVSTYAFGDREIGDWEFNPGPTPDQAINSLKVSFVDPGFAYSVVETDPWRDEADILDRGEERVENFSPTAVQSNGQVRRLAKRRLSRLLTASGTVRTPLSARRALGQRYITLNCSEIDDLNERVVEVVETEIDLETASILWSWVAVDPNIHAWNPETEEGDGPVDAERPPPEPLVGPVFDASAVEVFFESTGTGGVGPRLRVALGLTPDRDDLTYFLRWRVTGATAWVEAGVTDVEPGPLVIVESGFVTSAPAVDLQGAYKTGGGTLSPWGPIVPVEVDTTAENIAPDPPSDLSAAPGVGSSALHCRNPSSTNFNAARFYVGTTTFGAASPVGSDIPGSPGGDSDYTATLAAGVWKVWAVAKNAAGVASAPFGPVSVTVT